MFIVIYIWFKLLEVEINIEMNKNMGLVLEIRLRKPGLRKPGYVDQV